MHYLLYRKAEIRQMLRSPADSNMTNFDTAGHLTFLNLFFEKPLPFPKNATSRDSNFPTCPFLAIEIF